METDRRSAGAALVLKELDADSWFEQNCLSRTSVVDATVGNSTTGEIEITMNISDEPRAEHEVYFCLRNNEFILGTFLPIVALVTLVTNCLVSAVLLQRHMRTPVNVLLLAISMFNMLTGFSPIPVLVHFYSFRNYRDYVPYSWCVWYQFLMDFVPTVCHTTSIWLTVFVALQRYVYVCRPQNAPNWCTIRASTTGVLVTFLVAVLHYLPVLFEKECLPVQTDSMRYWNTTVLAMGTLNRDWFVQSFQTYMEAKCWFRFLFVNFVPSGSLIIFTVLLVTEIRKANKRRRTLISRERDAQSSRSSDSNSTTLMLLAIVILFLLVEIPPGIAFLLFLPTALYSDGLSTVIISVQDYVTVSLILNIGVLLSYPINFFIYCTMSRQFRLTFCSLCTGGAWAATEQGRTSMTKESRSRSRTNTLRTQNGAQNGDCDDGGRLATLSVHTEVKYSKCGSNNTGDSG